MACKCVVMQKLMSALGARKAAEMHRDPSAEWTTQDWLDHFDEEERYVLPLLPKSIADDILLDHERMRAQIKVKGYIVNKDLLERHASFEDDVVIYYLGHLLNEKRGGSVARSAAIQGRAGSRLSPRPSRGAVRGSAAIEPTTPSGSEAFIVLLALGAGIVLASSLS